MKFKPAILFLSFFLPGIFILAQPDEKLKDSARIATQNSVRKIRLVTDSLLKLIELSAPDTLKVNRLNMLALLFSNFSYAMKIVIKGLTSAEVHKDQELIFRYNNLIGTIYFRQGNYKEALNNYQQSLRMADRLNDDTQRFFVNLGLADVYIAQKDSVK